MCLQDSIKIPVAILKVGETRHARLDIEFPDAPVTFTLVQVNVNEMSFIKAEAYRISKHI